MPFGVSSWGPRGLVLSTKVDLLASVRWNCPQGRRGGTSGDPAQPKLRRRSVANPAITSFGRFRQHHHRQSSLKKSTASVALTRHADVLPGERARTQPFLQLRPPPPTRDVAYRDGDGLFLTDQHDQPFAARYAGVEQVPLQHRIVLGSQHDHLPRLPCPRSRAGCHRGPIATRHRRHPIARCSSRVVSPTRHTWSASLRCRLPSIRMARQERAFGRRRQKGRKHSPAIDVPSQRPAAPAQPRQFGGFRTQPGTPR
jgi:hypothetical protein